MPSSFFAGPHQTSPPMLPPRVSLESFSSLPRCLSTYSWNTHGLESTLLRFRWQQQCSTPERPSEITTKNPGVFVHFSMIDIREKSQHGHVFKRNRIYYISLKKHHFSTSEPGDLVQVLQLYRLFVTAQMIDFTGIYPQCGGRSTHVFRNQVNFLGIIDHRLVPSSSMGTRSGQWDCSITNVVLAVWWEGDNIGITSIYTPEIQP